MPARRSPTAEDAATARQILLDVLTHDVSMVEILNQLVPLHPRNNTFPGEVLLRLAADALDWAGIDRAHPVDLTGMRERLLPERSVSGRDRRKLQFAVLASAAQHGGVDVDLLDRGRLVADRRLLALRRLCGGRLYPDGGRPSRRPGTRGLPRHDPETICVAWTTFSFQPQASRVVAISVREQAAKRAAHQGDARCHPLACHQARLCR